jgi:transcriptional antiterminator RfaH
MARNWYALRKQAAKEEILWHQLLLKNSRYFSLDCGSSQSIRGHENCAYFPGYMFINVDIEEIGISTFQWMPHAIGLVSFDSEPAFVPEHLIYAVRKRVDEIAAVGGELFDGLKPGDEVKISSGPFAGYEALFDARLPGSERVRELIKCSVISGNPCRVEIWSGGT